MMIEITNKTKGELHIRVWVGYRFDLGSLDTKTLDSKNITNLAIEILEK